MSRPGSAGLLLLLLGFTASPCVAVVGHPSDWQERFSLPVADDHVLCATEYRGELYVGGRFQVIGGVRARHIARWDGSTWREVGGGLGGDVWSLAVYQDRLVAGGWMGRGGEAGVMHFDGVRWAPLGEAPPDFVGVLLPTDSGLVAGGFSFQANAWNVARWDGTRWTAMGDGFDGTVSALAEFQGSVYAAGYFDSSGTTRVAGLARWNGASWEAVGGGMSGDLGSSVYRLAVHAGTLVAGGLFSRAGTVDARFLARWDGARWDSLPSIVPPRAAGVGALASWNDTLYASVGGVPLARWGGAGWQVVAGMGQCRQLLATPHLGLVALGATRRDTLTGALLGRDVLAWDGAWHAFEPWTDAMHGLIRPNDTGIDPYERWPAFAQQARDVTVYRDHLWLMSDGSQASAGTPTGWLHLGSVVRWDGESWHDETPPGLGDPAHLIAAEDTLLAAGRGADASNASNLLTYDGTGWTPLGQLSGSVTALGRWRGAWYAATGPGSTGAAQLYRWEGPVPGWRQVGSFGPGYPYVTQLVALGDTLVCGGSFQSVDGVPASNLAGFDGSRWFALSGGAWLSGSVSDMTLFEGRLWCTGSWEAPGARSSLAVWEHGAWNPVAAPGSMFNLAEYRGRLFGATRLGFRSGEVMMWDGAAWQGLAGSPLWPGYMAGTSSGLFVTGRFTSAGGRPSYGLALWQGDPGTSTPKGALHLAQPWPNPTSAGASFAFTLPRSGRARVAVLDVRGALVAELADGFYEAGSHFLSWNFVDREGNRLGRGVYFVRLRAPGGIDETRRVVWL